MKGPPIRALGALAVSLFAPLGCADEASPEPSPPATGPALPACVPAAGIERLNTVWDWECAEFEEYTAQALGGHVHLALGDDGSVTVLLYDGLDRSLVIGRGHPGQALRTVRIDGAGPETDAGRHSAIAVGPDGAIHVVYHSDAGPGLTWAELHGLTVVHRELIEEAAEPRLSPSLAVSGSGEVHLSYYAPVARALRYAARVPGGSWSVSEIPPHDCPAPCDDPPDIGRFSSIGVVADEPVVAYYDRTRGDLVLARRQGGTWQQRLLDGRDPATGVDTGDVGRWPSLSAQSDGTIAVAYQDSTRGGVRYAWAPTGAVTIETIDDGRRPDPVHGAQWRGQVGAFTQLLRTESGQPVVYYFDSTDVVVKRSARTSGGWSPPSVVSDAASGHWLSAAITPQGAELACAESWDGAAGGGLTRRLRWWTR